MSYKSLKCSEETHRKLKYIQGLTSYSIVDVVDSAITEYLKNHFEAESKVYESYRALNKKAEQESDTCRQGSIL